MTQQQIEAVVVDTLRKVAGAQYQEEQRLKAIAYVESLKAKLAAKDRQIAKLAAELRQVKTAMAQR